jgi:hypothetical protein
MDYPDSEEDGAMTADGAAMLDDDDTEIGEGLSSTPAAAGDGRCGTGFSRQHPSINSEVPASPKCSSTGSSFMSCGSQPTDRPDFPRSIALYVKRRRRLW